MSTNRMVVVLLLSLVMRTYAAPMGRVDLPPTDVNIVRQPVDAVQTSGYALEGALGFISYDWDIGNDSFRNSAVTPQIMVSHSVTETLDLRAGVMFGWLSDSKKNIAEEGQPEVIVDPSLTVMRPSFGARMWVNRASLFPVYFDAQLNYYFASGEDVSIRGSMASILLGAGVNYAFDDRISAVTGLSFETSFTDGTARYDGVDHDLSLQGAGLTIGIRYDF